MKKIILFTAIIINTILLKASEQSIGSASIVSKEVSSINGYFDFTINLTATQNYKFTGIPTLKLPCKKHNKSNYV